MSVWTTSLSWARRIYAGYSNLMPNITTASEPIDLWTRMRRSLGRFTEPVSFVHASFWADCITNMFVFRFSVHTGHSTIRCGSWRRATIRKSLQIGQLHVFAAGRLGFSKRPNENSNDFDCGGAFEHWHRDCSTLRAVNEDHNPIDSSKLGS